jgi:hypothetical protein
VVNDPNEVNIDDSDNDEVGFINKVIAYDPNEVKSDSDNETRFINKVIAYGPNEVKSDSDNETRFINKVTAYEIYRRLGYTGKAYINSTLI